MGDGWWRDGLLGRAIDVLAGGAAHLVGGAIRDHHLGRAPVDFDLVVAGDGESTAKRLADRLPARLVRLGGDRFAAWRLVADDGIIDLWDRGTAPLESDLRRRDLTINAIALSLPAGELVDPVGGMADLAAHRLRACADDAFVDDPLRVLRLARFAAELPDFSIEPATLRLAAAAAPRLAAVAAERRRQELFACLGAERADLAVAVWLQTGVYPGLIAGSTTDDVVPACRAALRHATRARPTDPAVRRSILLLAVAVTIGHGRVEALFDDGWIGRSEARDVALVIDLGPPPDGTAARRWWLHRAGELWPTALCWAAGVGVDPGALDATTELARSAGREIFEPPPLLRGDDVATALGLAAGPELGVAIRRLRRRQIEGRVTTREEALAWLLSERRSSAAD